MKIVWCFLVMLFIVAFASPEQDAETPAFSFAGKHDTLSSSNLKNRLVYVYFWASWNLASRKHHSSLVKLYEKCRMNAYESGKRFLVADISLDEQDYMRQLAMKQDNLHWPYHYCDYKGWDGALVEAFQVKKLPQAYLINERGQIVAREIYGKALEQMVDSLLVSN